MTPERWQQMKDVLSAVLTLHPSERTAHMDSVCADNPSLRSELQDLLPADGPSLLDAENRSQDCVLLRGSVAISRIGTSVGPYRIVEQIGVGGMGEVYRAFRADDQYRKQVAIKLVRAGRSSDFVIGRFRHERQVLASLDHPNIARLFDGGTTDDGVPYFVMEFIQGKPIDRYCQQYALTVVEKLKLFLQLCSAIQYAHQRLIIHRDIKPSNVLVDTDGVPKLLDFGIAKIVDSSPQAPDSTLSVFRLFTPGYASPEQIKGEPITTASDVFSLGVLLYELLTGCRPYAFGNHAAHAIAKEICESEPLRLSSAVIAVTNVSAQEKSSRASLFNSKGLGGGSKLRRELRGDLDNIVLKALRKEPERRYATTDQFANDIRRHLEHLPVSASGDSLGYRGTKFVRRHKTAVVAGLLIAVTLVGGLSISLYEARIAQRRFDEVHSLAKTMIFDVHDAIQDLPGSTAARKLIIDKALVYLNDLASNSKGNPALQRELADAYRRIGEVQGYPQASNLGDPAGALKSFQQALSIRKGLLDSRNGNLDDLIEYAKISRLVDDAAPNWTVATHISVYQSVAQMLERALSNDPNNPNILQELVRNYSRQGDQLSGGFFESFSGDFSTALSVRQKQVQFAKRLVALNPTNVDWRRDLAASLGLEGDVLSALDRDPEADEKYLETRQILEQLRKEAANTKVLIALYDQHYRMVHLGLARNRVATAADEARSALEIAQHLATADPQNTVAQLLLAAAYEGLGEALAWKGDSGAEAAITKAISIDKGLRERNPSNGEFRSMQMVRYGTAAAIYLKLGICPRARDYYETADEYFSKRVSADAGNVAYKYRLAQIENGLASAGRHLGLIDQAVAANEKALSLTKSEADTASPNEDALYLTAASYSGLGDDESSLAMERHQSATEAFKHWKLARDYYKESLGVWAKITNPKLLSPTGYECTPIRVVEEHSAKVNRILRDYAVNSRAKHKA